VSRIAFETACRAGAVSLVDGYRTASSLKTGLVGRARPTKLTTPAIFVDSVAESTTDFTQKESQRTVRVGIRAVWGVYDAGQTVDQRDRFVDGLYAYVMDNGDHAFGANTTCSWVAVTDDEVWTPDWLAADQQPEQPMYSTLITLEGFAST